MNTDASLSLCQELEAWCKTQKLPYLRVDDLATKGYLTQEQKAWLADFSERWERLKMKHMNHQPADALLDPEYRKQTQGLKDMTATLNGESSSQVVFSTDASSVLYANVQARIDENDLGIAIRLKGKYIIGGDESSVAIMYNNLTGLNGLARDRNWYLQHMSASYCKGDQLVEGDQMELLKGNDVLTSCSMGDRNAIRVTQDFLDLQRGDGVQTECPRG